MPSRDLVVRPLREDDLPAVSALHVRGCQWAYDGIMPREYLDGLTVADDLARRRRRRKAGETAEELVAELDGAVVGWAAVGPYQEWGQPPYPDEPALDHAVGELRAIFVSPEEAAAGVGRALMAAALDLARAAGYPEIRLWVLEGNHRARRFYEKAGFAADGERAYSEASGVRVAQIRYARPL